jgi:hypothetical protein
MVTGLAFALAAMMLNSVAGFLESDATRRATRGRSLATQPRYLGGLLVDGLSWVSTVVALRYLPVFVVQAVPLALHGEPVRPHRECLGLLSAERRETVLAVHAERAVVYAFAAPLCPRGAGVKTD